MTPRTRHAYGAHRHQFGELYEPERRGEGPLPVAVVIHGGFWLARYDLTLMDALCEDLAARGWAAWNIEYRRVGRRSGGGYPATTDDVAAAVDRLSELAGPAGLDLSRVVGIGHSAGGHLALWAAGRGASAGVPLAGAVGQAAVSDLVDGAGTTARQAEAVRRFLGRGVDPASVPGANPAARLPCGIPQLLVHGERDELVFAELSRSYADAARAAGDEVELVLRPDDGHMEHVDPSSDAWAAVVSWLGRFAS